MQIHGCSAVALEQQPWVASRSRGSRYDAYWCKLSFLSSTWLCMPAQQMHRLRDRRHAGLSRIYHLAMGGKCPSVAPEPSKWAELVNSQH